MNESNSQAPHETRPDGCPEAATEAGFGTRDGSGAGDHDQPFAGWRPYHFSMQQKLRLLLLRGEILDSRLGRGRYAADLVAA